MNELEYRTMLTSVNAVWSEKLRKALNRISELETAYSRICPLCSGTGKYNDEPCTCDNGRIWMTVLQ